MDVTALLNSASAFAVQLRPVLSAISVLAGLVLFAIAGKLLIKGGRGMDEGPNFVAIGTSIFIGAALIQIARSIDDTRTGLLAGAGSEIRGAMTAAGVIPAGAGIWGLLISTCLVWVATLGAFGMFRGFLLWHKAGSGDQQGGSGDYFWRGLWHILGGAICINLGTG